MVRRAARRELLWAVLVLVLATTETVVAEDTDQLRERVLQGLGMSRLPDPAKMNVSQEEYERMHRVYLRRVAENRGPQSDVVQHFFTITHEGEMEPVRAGADAWLHFPAAVVLGAPHFDVDEAVVRALLWTAPPHDHGEVRLAAHDGARLLDRREVAALPTWTELDVTPAVRSWRRGANLTATSPLTLRLSCEGCPRHGAVFARTPPVLNVLLSASSSSRVRRAAPRRPACRKDQRCCRHSMEVVFKELKGFDFIVQPKKFDAGFCKGRCPPSFNPAHHHALIQSLIWKKNRQRAPKLCCAPYKLSDLEILHRDENDNSKLKVTKWDGMSVIDCKCS